MAQFRIPAPTQSDIVDILSHCQIQFGTTARQRYQDLILTALEDIANTPNRIGSSFRDEIAPGLKSFHLYHSRKRAATSKGLVQRPRHIIFYRLADDQVIEIVRLLHDALEVRLHLPQD